MLGRLGMDVDTCIEKYNSMCRKIFADKGIPVRLRAAQGSRFGIGKKSIALKGAFDHTILEKCIQDVIMESMQNNAIKQGLSGDDAEEVLAKDAACELLDDGIERNCKV
jgi:hypothetical protein